MERRFSRTQVPNESKLGSSVSLQKKLAEARRPTQPVPDLTDFMNDMFFGTLDAEKKAYNLTGGGGGGGGFMYDDDEGFDDSTRSNSSKMTQEWLEEAKRMVASSPSRTCDSPSRVTGSPRFVASQGRLSASAFDQRDPLSRSARRHRAGEGLSGEILSKSAKHSRNNSEAFDAAPATAEISPASAVQKWFSNILKPSNITPPPPSSEPIKPIIDQNPPSPTLPPRQSTHRRSRFQKDPNAAQPQGIPVPQSKRTFKTTTATAAPPLLDKQLLSPPKILIESAHRRSVSSSTCSFQPNKPLSPPRSLVESAHRQSFSSSIDKISGKPSSNGRVFNVVDGFGCQDLNGFLREQRIKIGKILNGGINAKAKIVLSGPSNSTSSMVAAICYAWLLENRMRMNKERVEGEESVVVIPVMNVRRGKMWKQQQAAWLFHHVGVDATALLFSDEVDLETLMMAKQLSILIVGQDILRTNGEVGSQCTKLTDNYCEDAYDLLQTPLLKKLLLAGILLDTQNLDASAKLSMARDAEAVLLLTVGSIPNYRNALYDELMHDQRDASFVEALEYNYGKLPNESIRESEALVEHKIYERKSSHNAIRENSDKHSNNVKSAKTNTISPKSAKDKLVPAQASALPSARTADTSRGKNKFSLAKWFGFGSK